VDVCASSLDSSLSFWEIHVQLSALALVLQKLSWSEPLCF
jgi:hypothetical protein